MKWFICRFQNKDTGKTFPFQGTGFSKEEARLELLKSFKRKFKKRLPIGKLKLIPIYKQMDLMLPKKLRRKIK